MVIVELESRKIETRALNFKLERKIESCTPYALSVAAHLGGYEELAFRPEGFAYPLVCEEDYRKLMRICGCNDFEDGPLEILSDNLKRIGYRTTCHIDGKTLKELTLNFPDVFQQSGTSVRSVDVTLLKCSDDSMYMGTEDFLESFRSTVESKRIVIGLKLIDDDDPGTHSFVVMRGGKRTYLLSDRYHCFGKPVWRLSKEKVEHNLYGFITIEKTAFPKKAD